MLSSWEYDAISVDYQPRQFEYSPHNEHEILFATIHGEVVLITNDKNRNVKCLGSNFGKDDKDAVLGISWFKKNPGKFVTGSSSGKLICGNKSLFDKVVGNCCIVEEFEPFEELTSVHINCLDEYLLTSGYSNDIRITDIATGKALVDYTDIHEGHINIARFSNLTPNLFATSSFDTTAKLWDMRMKSYQPIYTMTCKNGLVMLCFSPDDSFILTSGVDNEITQFFTLDGRPHLSFESQVTTLASNYTRSYYSSSGSLVFSGASESPIVSVFCACTGKLVTNSVMHPDRRDSSLYVQSLRGDPFHENCLSVLVNYKDMRHKCEIVQVSIFPISVDEGEGRTYNDTRLRSPLSPALALPSSRLTDDMLTLVRSGDGADVLLTVQSADAEAYTIPAHRFLLCARCPLFRTALENPSIQVNERGMSMIPMESLLQTASLPLLPCTAYLLLHYLYSGGLVVDEVRCSIAHFLTRKTLTCAPFDYTENDVDESVILDSCVEVAVLVELLVLALELHLPALAETVDFLLTQCLTPVTAGYILVRAKQLGRALLTDRSEQFLSVYREEVEACYGTSVPQDVLEAAKVRRKISVVSFEELQTTECGKSSTRPHIAHASISHTCSLVMGHVLVFLGGQGSPLINDPNCYWTFDTETCLWRSSPPPEHALTGPLGIAYHCTVTIPLANESLILLIGGKTISRGAISRSALRLLDCRDKAWSEPPVEGDQPPLGSLVYSTACAVFNEELCRAEPSDMRPFGSIPFDFFPDKVIQSPAAFVGCGKRLIGFIVIFGGLHVSNDPNSSLHILRCFLVARPESGLAMPSGRRGSALSFQWSGESTLPSASSPSPRSGHASALIRCGGVTDADLRMVMFGGLDQGRVLRNDLWLLSSISDSRGMYWQELTPQDRPTPVRRCYHTLTSITNDGCLDEPCRLLLLGGRTRSGNCDDLWCLELTFEHASPWTRGRVVTAQWTKLILPGSSMVSPCNRQNHTSYFLKGRLFVWGGLIEDAIVDLNPAVHRPHFKPDAMSVLICNGPRKDWRWLDIQNAVVSPEKEIVLRLPPGRELLVRDLLRLLRPNDPAAEPDFSFRLSSQDTGTVVRGHRAMLAARSDAMRALLTGAGRSMKEAAAGEMEVVTPDGVSAELCAASFQTAIVYMYSDYLVGDADTLLPVVALGDRYRMPRLVSLVEGILCRVVESNAEQLFGVAGPESDLLPGGLPALHSVAIGALLRAGKLCVSCIGSETPSFVLKDCSAPCVCQGTAFRHAYIANHPNSNKIYII